MEKRVTEQEVIPACRASPAGLLKLAVPGSEDLLLTAFQLVLGRDVTQGTVQPLGSPLHL
ncbi:MAG: hypothetical protein JRH13_04275 [Deltaproteobacteria bacterium]|nr:hypothetical protein [Deltaproteobacteria bacterium]MBW2031132.1 hypothetical protein [Deltaproteobacteria bacterium]MBW2128562.1 hypothetical protein [Deltaproteobacteria bacterium]MBW2303314.1 hypothetical protein [Deltaproteobacteria bacterium]